VQRQVRKIDPAARQRIREYLEQRVANLGDPRQIGKPLKGELASLWRYRVGDYRLICELRDEALVVLVIRIGHRREVYR
jgi:mRNA interferase RelE/StbE